MAFCPGQFDILGCCMSNQWLAALQGLPEGHTEACYPVLRPGVDSHRAPPLKDSDADKREVRR